MERSLPLTSRSQPRWGRYPILPNLITSGNAVSTNTPTACSDSTSQKVQISLLCLIPMSKGSRINSTLAPERYSATELLARFSSTPRLSPLHFAVEWAPANTVTWRRWMRSLITEANVAHELHLLDFPDAICKERLRQRNAGGEHPY